MELTSSSNKIKSIIAIGNPIIDIIGEVSSESITKYELKWGQTVFANEKNLPFFEELEKNPKVSYVLGGSIQNTMRYCSWVFNKQNLMKNFKLTMLGCVGDDKYGEKILDALKENSIIPLIQKAEGVQTSRCGVGIYKKDRCLVPQILASNKLTKEFVQEHMKEILNHDALVIEAYFLQECYDICVNLVEQFKKDNKIIMFTLGAVFMIEFHNEKMMTIANKCDYIIGNMEEAFALINNDKNGKNIIIKEGEKDYKKIFENFHKKLEKNNKRIAIITDGGNGVICSKYNFDKNQLEFIIQSFPEPFNQDEIVDLNGAGDGFLGGFISQLMIGKDLLYCSKIGNACGAVNLRNIGSSFDRYNEIKFD